MIDPGDPRVEDAARHDPTVATLVENGGPITRARWMALNYPDGPPKNWTAEHEGALPPFLQKDSDESSYSLKSVPDAYDPFRPTS